MSEGSHLAAELQRQGFTHVYVSFAFQDRASVRRWAEAASGLRPYSSQERTAMMGRFEQRWKPLLAEAAATGRMRATWESPKGVLFEIAD
jgi:hypothetical protein